MMENIAVIDDDQQSRLTTTFELQDAGFNAIPIEGSFHTTDELIDELIKRNINGVISDHRLQPGGLAPFTGSELLAELYDRKIPSVLITQFLDMDADVSIRQYRDKLPAVIGRGSQSPEIFTQLLEFVRNEIAHGRCEERKPYRALIRIVSVNIEDDTEVIDGIITNWSTDRAVRFPFDLIPPDIKKAIHNKEVERLLAFVNVGAFDSSDLFITDIHAAPNLEDSDGLG
jgi:hypothetical protein